MISLVNMSTLGIPRCLNSKERYSFATMGVYVESSMLLHLTTTLVMRSLLSFSWNPLSVPLCLTLPLVYSSGSTNWFMVACGGGNVIACPVQGILVPIADINMCAFQSGIRDTTRFSNKGMLELMEEFKDVISSGSKIMDESGEAFIDGAVITEIFLMSSLSARCNHLPDPRSSSVAYERVPKEMSKITTQLDLMNINMTTNTCSSVPTRKNGVTQSIVCAVLGLTEFALKIKSMKAQRSVLLITHPKSVTFGSMLIFVFRHFSLHYDWGTNVTMTMLMDQLSIEAMNAYSGVSVGVTLVPTTNTIISAQTTMNAYARNDTYAYIVTESITIANMCASMNEFVVSHPRLSMDVRCTTYANTIQDSIAIMGVVDRVDGVMEGVVCSDPVTNAVTITSGFLSEDKSSYKQRNTITCASLFSRLRWFTSMVRHMNLGNNCLDCKVASMISRPLAFSIKRRRTYEMADESELDHFTARVGVDGLDDLAVT